LNDAVRDGLRAIKNVFDDQCYIPGAGAFEVAAHLHLTEFKHSVSGRKKLGVQAFADALLIIPKVLAANSGLDAQDCLLELVEQSRKNSKSGGHGLVGLDIVTGKAIMPEASGIIDNYCVKKQIIHLATIMASKLLLVDEIIRAGRTSSGAAEQAPQMD
jgi:T-complex protein 1 subunit zeta